MDLTFHIGGNQVARDSDAKKYKMINTKLYTGPWKGPTYASECPWDLRVINLTLNFLRYNMSDVEFIFILFYSGIGKYLLNIVPGR